MEPNSGGSLGGLPRPFAVPGLNLSHPPASLSPPTRDSGGNLLQPQQPQSAYNTQPQPQTAEDFEVHPPVPMLRAQLKMMTQERDLLNKKDSVPSSKRESQLNPDQQGDPTIVFNPIFAGLDYHHMRTASDSASPAIIKNVIASGGSNTLSRSHSIAASAPTSSAGDKNFHLSTAVAAQDNNDVISVERFQDLQVLKKKQKDTSKRLDQALKDTEFYLRENETLRNRYKEVVLERQRLEQDCNSMKIFMDGERKEMDEMRRQQQELLESNGGESLSLMYGTLLRNYESVKGDMNMMNRRYEELAGSHSAAVAKLEDSQDEINRYKKLYQDVLTERNQFKQQCTQAIRQWDQALRERNDYKDALAKIQRQHDEAVKEVNQAMTVRIKASKDLKRLTEERNAAMQEYSLIMSERDSVHKEIERLQEEVNETRKKMSNMEGKVKIQDDEKRKQLCQVELLKREIEQALYDRDKALKEAHELREKLGCGKMSSDHGDNSKHLNRNRFDSDKNRKDREFASSETIDSDLLDGKIKKIENLEQANTEIERLRKINQKLGGELQDSSLEADVAKGRRDWAFTERDKVVLERESIRTLCDKLRRERDRAVSDLAEALRDSDDMKKQRNEILKESKELRERLETLEKELRLKNLQRSPGHCHSNDSAIDSDLQEWETENVDVNMIGLGSTEELGLDLAGGRDDIHAPILGEKPIYISSIDKGSFLDGKLRVNDCILRVNDTDCRDIDRNTLINTLRNANSSVSLLVKRRKFGRKHQTTLHLGNASSLGLTLDLGVYVARINPGSVAAREGTIAIGDRILNINDNSVEHVDSLSEALRILTSSGDSVTLTLAKSTHALSIGPLSSSSSGHNLMLQEKLDNDEHQHRSNPISPKHHSSATSPIKDTIKGSQEFVKKMLQGHSSSSKYSQPHSGLVSSSSSEKVYHVTKPNYQLHSGGTPISSSTSNSHGSRESKSTFGLMETVKEKLDNVRGRKRSKDPMESSRENVSSSRESNDFQGSDSKANVAIATLDSVLDLYPSDVQHQQQQPQELNSSTRSSKGKKRNNMNKNETLPNNNNNNNVFVQPFKVTSGGTWPRTKGGPVIEQGTGTILHPQKFKKERMPLTELLNNIPKYPPEKKDGTKLRNDNLLMRSAREHPRRSRPLTTYDMTEGQQNESKTYSSPNREELYGMKPAMRKLSNPGLHSGASLGIFNPPQSAVAAAENSMVVGSDISPDHSVKSANAEKEVLERYLRKSGKNSPKTSNDIYSRKSKQNPEQQQQASKRASSYNYPPQQQQEQQHQLLQLQQQQQQQPTSGYGSTTSASFYSPPVREQQQQLNFVRPNNSGFSPYFSSPGPVSMTHSSPRYTSPPPSGDSLLQLGSPIPDYSRMSLPRSDQHLRMYNSGVYDPVNYMHTAAMHGLTSNPSDIYQSSSAARYGNRGHHQQQLAQMPQPQQPVAYSQSAAGYLSAAQQQYLASLDDSVSPPLYSDPYIHRTMSSSVRPNTLGKDSIYHNQARISSNYSLGSSCSKISSTSSIDRPMSSSGNNNNHYYQQQQPIYQQPLTNNQFIPHNIHYNQHPSPYGVLGLRESPQLPSFTVRYLYPDGRIMPRHQEPKKPGPGETRIIQIEKTSEQLGIAIEEGLNKAVFVSSVADNSLASMVGLQVGDQLLEVGGLNLRIYGKEKAKMVLQQTGNSFTMKVQFNLDEYRMSGHLQADSESDDENNQMLTTMRTNPNVNSEILPNPGAGPNRSGSPTPRNSPKMSNRKNSFQMQQQDSSASSTLRDSYGKSAHSTLTRHQAQQVVSSLMMSPPRAPASPPYEGRLLTPIMQKSGDLGVRLVGGNAVGIFVHSVEIDSPAYACGLRSADQILEYNHVDLRQATAEQAAYELAKPAKPSDELKILVQYNPDKYNQIKDRPGDAYYVRAMFDRNPDLADPPQLAFRRDDILFIDNTMYNGEPGHWSAWVVDVDGKKTHWGIVPSKYKVEEELLLKRSIEVESDGSRRGWGSTRSSFFKRNKKKNFYSGGLGRSFSSSSSSKESKELASFSDMASLSFSDGSNLNDVDQMMMLNPQSYIRVERLDYLVFRPVLIIGPLAEAVLDKLVSEYPHKYARYEPKYTNWSQEDLEREMIENNVVDFRRRGSTYECTTVDTIRDICDRNQHCILNIHLDSVERLHQNQIYPIVLLIKFKNVKQIKEVKVPHFHAERISQKDAKNIFEHTQKLEQDYKHLISDTIHAGANLMLMCTSIASAIDQEQNKTLWVPSGTIW